MIPIRSAEEIELLRVSNLLVSKTLAEVAKWIRPGVTTLELDKKAEEFIRDHGAVPAFLGYNGYPNTLCTSVNSAVVHGIPSKYELKEGDIVSIDCGVLLNNYYGDSAYTFMVGEVTDAVKKLLQVTKESLFKGIEQAVEGKRTGDIGYAIQSYCESHGYSVVREMIGHGIGTKLHEPPEVPNYGRRGNGPLLKKGMVICIEPMINMGEKNIYIESDGWTVKTRDNKPSAHFELAVAVDKGKADLLSTFEYIEEVLKK
ncbi:MAG TPA: type I methionyl aminopeptidase [Bacteroidales bacterium]|nr:type I methionyl aminopeptidase [Bacteroidales bacterium]HOK97587.1 type I methionyl aminopeptidase [Bacteroidales bacterium]HPO64407.1 type I methionyl aminopeptidase [Bacteroidales bacterium]